jgi:hypothetical protein
MRELIGFWWNVKTYRPALARCPARVRGTGSKKPGFSRAYALKAARLAMRSVGAAGR